MKDTCALLLALFFFLFALATRAEEAASATTDPGIVVKDIYGAPLINGAQYYTLPSLKAQYDRKDLFNTPFGIEHNVRERQGFILKIESTSSRLGDHIKINKTLQISVAKLEDLHHAQSKKLVVVKSLDTFPGWPVKIGSAEQHKADGVVEGKFSIQPHQLGYKLEFCYGEDATKRCGNVGIHFNTTLNASTLTVTEGTPLPLQFEKVVEGICTTEYAQLEKCGYPWP